MFVSYCMVARLCAYDCVRPCSLVFVLDFPRSFLSVFLLLMVRDLYRGFFIVHKNMHTRNTYM